MRRAKPISVRVRAPSRGLISRLPGESADRMPGGGIITPGAQQRAASRASNVRYEDGVVCNAPGYEKVKLIEGLLDGIIAHWNLNEAVSGVFVRPTRGQTPPDTTRYDDSGNHRDLTEVTGRTSTGLPVHVTSEEGKLNLAAVFTVPS